MKSIIPYGKQDISLSDIKSVVKVLNADLITQGPATKLFESAISFYCNSKYTILFNSATSALHLACLALGIKKNDIVWTSPITFVASSNCALYCGAKVDFIDIDALTFNICIKKLEDKLIFAKGTGTLPKLIIAVHMAGQSCDMRSLKKLSKKYGFKIIEDASHAIGGKYLKKPIGNCLYSDITIFSFHPVKIITTGEGGAALTNKKYLAQKMALLRSHGITRDIKLMSKKNMGSWYYEQIELGYNYRMTDFQAALGLSQLGRIDDFVMKRNLLAKRYNVMFKDLPIKPQVVTKENYSSYHLYIIRLDLTKIKKSHFEVFQFLKNGGVEVNLHYFPVYLQPYYKKLGFKLGLCPEAENYYKEAISLPLFYKLSLTQQKYIYKLLKKALE